jgi:membrane protease YdiL (CAAX protease family)
LRLKARNVMSVIVRAVAIGILVAAVGTIPGNVIVATNLHAAAVVPWAAPVIALYLWLFWRYLRGLGPPHSTARVRRIGLRAGHVSAAHWTWALSAGALAMVVLLLVQRVAGRLLAVTPTRLPDLAGVPSFTVLVLLLTSAVMVAIVEEAAFRGYMQGPIERHYGRLPALVLTAVIFTAVHFDITPMPWPYDLAAAVVYGLVTSMTDSIRPAIVLHAGVGIVSNIALWQRGSWVEAATLVQSTGTSLAVAIEVTILLAAAAVMAWAFIRLARIARPAAKGAVHTCLVV